MKRWTVAVLALLMVAGCAERGSVDPEAAGNTSAVFDVASLVGSTWVLQSTSLGGKVPSPPSGRPQSLAFTTAGIDAYDGCNDVTSEVTYEGDQIKLGTVWNTLMACRGDSFQRAVATVFANDGTVRASRNGTTLTISGYGDSLTYGPEPALMPARTPTLEQELAGPLWQLTSWSKDSPTYVVPKGSRASVLFSADRIVADDGCNDHTASVVYGSAKVGLAFSHQRSPQLGCRGPSADPRIGAAVAALLSAPVAAHLEGGTLTLVGQATLTLTRVEDRIPLPSGSPFPSVAPLATVDASALRSALVGKVWRLVTVTTGSTTTALAPAQGAQLLLTATSYSANDGCATHIGLIRYTITGVNTTDQGIHGTPCPTNATAAKVSAAYEAVFAGNPRFQFQGGGGVTLGAGLTLLTFAKP